MSAENQGTQRGWECFTCGKHFDTHAAAAEHHGLRRDGIHQVAYCACGGWAVAS